MARITYDGFDELDKQLETLGRESVRRIVKAGGDAVASRMRDVIQEHHHVVTGEMKRATETGYIKEHLGETHVDVYPGAKHDTTGANGFRNSSKAFLIEQGKGYTRKTALAKKGKHNKKWDRQWHAYRNKKNDDFVSSEKLGYEQAAQKAMLEENEKILNEIQ